MAVQSRNGRNYEMNRAVSMTWSAMYQVLKLTRESHEFGEDGDEVI